MSPARRLHAEPAAESGCASADEMADFARLAGEAACSVLLYGETGSGKTHLARLIHQAGPRARRPFVRVNCGAIPDSLFEREMFGHVRGAFTDARDSGPGFMEAAEGGTLFLDEIGELPLQLQPKLLTVLEDGTFRRLGSPRETRAEVRVIAATNADLRAMVAQKRFREDLFHRLAVLRYTVPPLRRRDDLEAVVLGMLRRLEETGRELELTLRALAVIVAYPWPGNIRELENALRHAAVHARGGVIDEGCLPPEVRSGGAERGADGAARPVPARYVAPGDPHEERASIAGALRSTGGNRTRAARLLGMSRGALWIKLQRHGMMGPAEAEPREAHLVDA